MSDVFISYSRLDKEFVGKLRDALANEGQDIWIDWESIPPSQAWWDEIKKGIAKANNFVVVLSPNSMASPICQMEIEYARQLGKRIIPVVHLNYDRQNAITAIATRLADVSQDATRLIWGERQPHSLYDANDSEMKHINYFFFRPEDDFAARFKALFEVIRTDYAHKEQHTTLELRAMEWHRRDQNTSFLLLDDELAAAKVWLSEGTVKEPAPTDLQREYIAASERRTRQLRNIRQASIIGSLVAVVAIIFAIGASLVGVQATNTANIAATQAADANSQQATATRQVATAVVAQGTAESAVATAVIAQDTAQAALVQAEGTATQIPPTLTQAAVVQDIASGFVNILLRNRDNPSAQIAQADRLIERYPEEALSWQTRGLVYAEQGNYVRAITDYDRTILLEPNLAQAFINRGLAYLELGDYERAIMDYDRAIVLDPNDAIAFNNRGVAYSDLGDDERAIADFDRAIAINPNDALAFNNRGSAYGRLDEYQLAIADFDRAIAINPDYALAFINRGATYGNLGNYENAIMDYNRAIAINPNYSLAFNNRAIAYYFKAASSNTRRADLQQALMDWREAQRLGGTLPQSILDVIPSIEAELSGQTIATPTPASTSFVEQGEAFVGDNPAELVINTVHVWTYAGQAGEALTLTTLAEWNTLLVLTDANGEALEQNDDTQGLPNNNSQLSFILPASDTYLIVVLGFQNATGGEYTLRVESIFSGEE